MVRKWIKRVAIFLAIIIFLLAGLVLFLHTATGKSLVRKKVESYLRQKWMTEVSIGNINYRLPNWVALENVLILDHQKDTLLSGQRLYVGIRLLKLLSNTVDVSGISLEAIVLDCRREARDTGFNFQFILDAFKPADNKNPEPSPGSPMQLSVNQLHLDHVRFKLFDKKEKFYLSAFINSFTCLPDDLNLQKTSYRFKNVLLKNSQVTIVDSSSEINPSKVSIKSRGDPEPLFFSLNKLSLQNIQFSYEKPRDKTDIAVRIDSLQLHHSSIDFKKQVINSQAIRLSNSSVHLLTRTLNNNKTNEKKQTQTSEANDYWNIKADAISLRNNSFVYHNSAAPVIMGLDYQHLNLQGINLETRQNKLDSSGLYSIVQDLSLTNEQLNIKRVSGILHLTDNLLDIKDAAIVVNHSQVLTRGNILWPLKQNISPAKSPQLLIENSFISYGDLLAILPVLKNTLSISLSPSEKLRISGNLSGTLQNFELKDIRLATSNKQFQFRSDLRIHMGKPGPSYTANIHQLQIKKQIISKNLLHQLEKQKINLPEQIILTGKIQTDTKQLQADVTLNSTYGHMHIKGKAKSIDQPGKLNYEVQLDANQLETGKWIGLDSVLGKITGQILINGRGLQTNRIAATAQLQLQTATINGYSFSNIDLEGGFANSAFTAKGRIQDPNLETEIDISGHLQPGSSVRGKIHIARADLNQLGLSPDTIILASNISLDASYEEPKKLNATIRADSNKIKIQGKEFFTDSLFLVCKSDTDSTYLLANAPFMNATLSGNYPIDVLPAEIKSFFKVIYPMYDTALTSHTSKASSNYNTSLNASLKQSELLHLLIPEFELKQPITITGQYNSGENKPFLLVLVTAPGISYDKYVAHGLNLTAQSVDSAIQFSLTGREILAGTNPFLNANIKGHIQKNLILVKGLIEDSSGKEYYAANVEVKTERQGTTIRVLDDLTLAHRKWKVPPDNWIRMVNDGFIVHHLSLENKGQALHVNSKDLQTLSPIDIKIDSFDIANILALLSYNDTLLARGTLKADVSIHQPIQKIPILTGEIRATNLFVYDIPLGELHFQSSTKGDSLALQGRLSGRNQLDFSGHIHLNDRGMNLQTRLQKLDMSFVQAFAKDILTRTSGQITGGLQLKGKPDSFQCHGTIYFDSVAFAIKELNTLYKIDKQKLVINYPELDFGQFTLNDSANHPLTIQGKLKMISAGEYGLNLVLETKDFIVLNVNRKAGSTIYGKGIMDAKIEIKGTTNEPVIEGNAYLHEKSNVHFLMSPASTSTKNRKEGIVFVNIDTLAMAAEETTEPRKDSIVARNAFKGLKYNLNLRVHKDAEFSVIIDPSTNDELVVKGEGRLNAGVQENGNMGITGVYQLESGYYKMNNLLLRGKFMLVKGSSITFNGNPMSAEADVTTEYEIQTSPKGLLQYKETDDPAYSERLPFLVVFMIKGPVSKPNLSFDIKLKEGKAGLKSSLKSDIDHELLRLRNDVTALNKQVFSLLLTKRFTATGSGTDLASSNLNANNALQEGVSSFLSEAMNQVADQLIKGVDIDVNMKSYKTGDDPVSKTDLGVAMSKDLLENRLIIRVEENFAVGGDATAAAPKSGTQYIPDITSTYKLSKDGRFQVKAYQKNEYDAVVQGYFTEVGVSFSIELTYDKFKELLHSKKKLPGEEK